MSANALIGVYRRREELDGLESIFLRWITIAYSFWLRRSEGNASLGDGDPKTQKNRLQIAGTN